MDRGRFRKSLREITGLAVLVFAVLLAARAAAYAEEAPAFVICSQNLHRLESPEQKRPRGLRRVNHARRALAERILQARCDAVALQEVYGKTERSAKRTLDRLAAALSAAGTWSAYVGDTTDPKAIRNGFLIRDDHVTVQHVDVKFSGGISKLGGSGPLRYFGRQPLGLAITVRPGGGKAVKRFYLLSAHLKSKTDGWKDKSGTGFELLRMELSEALRDYALKQAAAFQAESGPVVLVDRNSDADSASAEILRGRLSLADFRYSGGCRLAEDDKPSCAPRHPEKLVPVLATMREGGGSAASFRFRSRMQLIDEILIAPDSLWLVRRPGGRLDAGTEGRIGAGSDHLLLWAAMSW